jgi:hypothetical protein
LRVETGEIDDAATNRNLTAETVTFELSLPETSPQKTFGFGGVTAKLYGSLLC